jgi:hypothetical protein
MMPPTAWLAHAVVLLAEGLLPRERVVEKCVLLVPPERARRRAELARQTDRGQRAAPTERARRFDDERIVAVGARRLVQDALCAAIKRGAIVSEQIDRIEYLRLPDLPREGGTSMVDPELADRIAEDLEAHPVSTSPEIAGRLKVRREKVDRALGKGVLFLLVPSPPHRSRRARCWVVVDSSPKYGSPRWPKTRSGGSNGGRPDGTSRDELPESATEIRPEEVAA